MSDPRPNPQRPDAGLTTVELMLTLVVLAILAAVALPSFRGILLEARRSDAILALAQIQQAQERRRAEQPVYTGTLGSGGLDLPGRSPSGHYQLATSVSAGSEATAYTATATARNGQLDDTPCTHLRVEMSAGRITQRSGSDATFANDELNNRRCWKH